MPVAKSSLQQGTATRHYSQQLRTSCLSTDVIIAAIKRVYATVFEAGRVCPKVLQMFGSSIEKTDDFGFTLPANEILNGAVKNMLG